MTIVERDGIPGKICIHCDEWQLLSRYSPRVVYGVALGDGYQSYCKTCNCSKGTKTIDYREAFAIGR